MVELVVVAMVAVAVVAVAFLMAKVSSSFFSSLRAVGVATGVATGVALVVGTGVTAGTGTGEKATANASVSSCKRTNVETLSGTVVRIVSEKTAVVLGKPAEAGAVDTPERPVTTAMARIRIRTAEAVMVAWELEDLETLTRILN